VLAVSAEGTRQLSDGEIGGLMQRLVEQRNNRPDGPAAG
jgi:hypothetical protein